MPKPISGISAETLCRRRGALVRHYRNTAFMGLFTVLKNIRSIKKNFRLCEHDLLAFKPDLLILVDYPGFNLRMAAFAKKHNIRVFYYISPKIWAWKQGRIKKIKAFVDELFTILPFETAFYKQFGVDVHYVGNPSIDAIENRPNKNEAFSDFCKRNSLPEKPVIALLAGSRKQEIKYNLTEMLKLVNDYPGYQFVLAGAPSLDRELYERYIKGTGVKLLYNQTYQILQQSKAALVTSGTATLETAILRVPQIVCYKSSGGKLFYNLVMKMIKVNYVSLVNLIVDRMIVKELLQHHLTHRSLKEGLDCILFDEQYRQQMLSDYDEMHQKLGGLGASERAAEKMLSLLQPTQKRNC